MATFLECYCVTLKHHPIKNPFLLNFVLFLKMPKSPEMTLALS